MCAVGSRSTIARLPIFGCSVICRNLLTFPRIPVRTDDRVLGRPFLDFFPEGCEIKIEVLNHVVCSPSEPLFAVRAQHLTLIDEGGDALDPARSGCAEEHFAAADVQDD